MRADDTHWEAGLQGGWSFDENKESFNQGDIIVAHKLPLQWRRWEVLHVGTRLTAAASVLDGGGDTGLLGTLGLELVIGLGDSPFEVQAGSGATLMSRYKYGDKDLGGAFQFTSHIGLEYRLLETLSGFARAQHMSNSGIYSENPGVNLAMIGLRSVSQIQQVRRLKFKGLMSFEKELLAFIVSYRTVNKRNRAFL